MNWHQPWLLSLDEVGLEELLNDARTRAKENKRAGRFGLAMAWNGLAHEIVERMGEVITAPAVATQMRVVDVGLAVDNEHRAVYAPAPEGDWPF